MSEKELCSGFLEKLVTTNSSKSWVKFYCVIQDGRLIFSRTRSDPLPIGSLKLSGLYSEKIDATSFKIFAAERTHVFQSLSPVDEWISALHTVLKASKHYYHVIDNSDNSDTRYKELRDLVQSGLYTTKKIQTIYFRPGSYVEKDIMINKNITLEPLETSTKDVVLSVEDLVVRGTDNFQMKKLTLQNTNISIDSGLSKVSNCVFDGSCIELVGDVLCEIHQCTFSDITYGLNLRNSSSALIQDCKFTNFENSIQLFNDGECLIENSVFKSVNGNSIFTTSSKNITISKNKFIGNVFEVKHPNFIFIQNEFQN
jgi:hypothetical protein